MQFDPQILKQLIETFKTELEEQLHVMTNGLLEIELGHLNSADKNEKINAIFRASHNIKGTSASLGMTELSEIAHHIETIFSEIQSNARAISSNLIDLCLEAVDKIRTAMQCYVDKKTLPFNLNEFLTRLDAGESAHQTHISRDKNEAKIASSGKFEKPNDELEPSSKTQTMIRVSMDQIEHISALLEEMQINKIAIDDYRAEIRQLSEKLKSFSDIWKQITYFMRLSSDKGLSDHLQKMSNLCENCFADILNATIRMDKEMKARINALSTTSSSLQEEIRSLQLVPLSNFLDRMPRYVRDLSHELNKKVELKIKGDNIKIDKTILEKLNDPIIHILRNGIDHGIETPDIRQSRGKSEIGTIHIDISEKNNCIHMKIIDDGMGIDIKKIIERVEEKHLMNRDTIHKMNEQELLELIFMPGFSMKEMITEVSGRGVGLDVVKTNILNLSGQVKISTKLHVGTTFELIIPSTLTSERGLWISCAGQLFVLPISSIIRVLSLNASEILNVEGSQVVMLDAYPVPLKSLADLLGSETRLIPQKIKLPVVFLKANDKTVAFLVDEVMDEREIVIKPLSPPLENAAFIGGGTLSGNNQVIVVLNPHDLVNSVFKSNRIHRVTFQEDISESSERPHILVVDDSITTRTLEKNILESQNYQVTVAVNGEEAWDLLQKNKFSLLITDIVMPRMDGFALTEKVKQSEALHDLPVIIVTSLGSDAEKARGIEVGADAYVIKNEFESGALLEIVGQLV